MGYPKYIYDAAWSSLDARAAAARALNASRRQEVYQAVPEIPQIEREMALQATGITKAVVSSPDRAGALIEELAGKNLELQRQREALLTGRGFPPDYLQEQFGCPICKDKGYVETRMCACLRKALEQAAFRQLSALGPVEECTFDRFRLDYYPDVPDETGVSPRSRMQDILQYCRRYAQTFTPRAESLLLLGQTGLGKTHLSLAISRSLTEAGYGVVYTPVQKLMDTLEADKFSYDADKKENYTENIQSAGTCDLLVLDDLGTEFSTQFSQSVLFSIVNTRQVEGRPTIISTNLELSDIEKKYSQRMLSRLVCAYQVLRFAGKDIRFVKKFRQSPV